MDIFRLKTKIKELFKNHPGYVAISCSSSKIRVFVIDKVAQSDLDSQLENNERSFVDFVLVGEYQFVKIVDN